MKWLDSVQLTAHQRYLNQQLQKQVLRQPKNFRHAQSIGILVDLVGDIEQLQGAVQGYARKLQSVQKDVHILGYCNDNKVPDGLSIEAFCQKDLNWALIPKHAAARKFMEMPFDILIGVQFQPSLVLEYILASSPAQLRVGYFLEETSAYYDLMVQTPNPKVDVFLEKAHNYLNIINQRIKIA